MPPRRTKRIAKVVIKARAPRKPRGVARVPPKPRARTLVVGGTRTLANRSSVGARQTITPGNHPKFGSTLRVSGTDYLGAVSLPGVESVGSILAQYDNTVLSQRTSLGVFAQLYSRWHAIKWRYIFRPSVPEGTTAGSFIMGQDPDPFAHYISGDADNVVKLRGLDGASIRSAWQVHTCDLPPNRDYTSLWCVDPDVAASSETDRLDLAGRMYFAVAAKTGLAAGATLGTMELEYDVQFFGRRLGAAALTRECVIQEQSSAGMDTIRSAIKVGKFAVDTFITIVKPFLTSAVAQDLEPMEDTLRNYRTITLATAPSESKTIKGASASLGGFPAGKYTVTAYFWSPTVDLSVPNWGVTWPLVYNTDQSQIAFLDGPSVNYAGSAWVCSPHALPTGTRLPGFPNGIPHVGMMIQYTFGIQGRRHGYVDFALPSSLQPLLEADVVMSLVINNSPCPSVIAVPASLGSSSSVKRCLPAEEKLSVLRPPIESDEEFEFDDAVPMRRRNYGPGLGAGVPGADDYKPSVAGAGLPAGVPRTPSRK